MNIFTLLDKKQMIFLLQIKEDWVTEWLMYNMTDVDLPRDNHLRVVKA